MQKLWPRNKQEKQYIFNYRYYIKLNITFSTSHTFNSDSSIQIHEFRHIKRCEDVKMISWKLFSTPHTPNRVDSTELRVTYNRKYKCIIVNVN